MNRILKLFIIFMIFSGFAFAQAGNNVALSSASGPSQGEKLFKENKPEEAVQVLENEILNGQVSANTYNFLGLGYYQLGNYEKSVKAFERGIEVQPSNVRILAFNQGNAYYALKDYNKAVSSYTKSLKDDVTFYDALLNRANALLMGNQYRHAREDYIDFLKKCPDDPQRENIEEIIRLLEQEMERLEEEARLAAEANKAIWEQIDAGLPVNKAVAEGGPEWEPVNDLVEAPKTVENKPDWEQIEQDKLKGPVNNVPSEKVEIPSEVVKEDIAPMPKQNLDSELVKEDSSREQNVENPWEPIDTIVGKPEEIKEQLPYWEDLDSLELEEMKRLEEESLKEREKYLAEQKRLKEQEEKDRKSRDKMDADAEEKYKDQLLKEMMAAEEARRQQLLDDVANSLRKNGAENMSTGTEDIIDYDFEGELD